MTVYVENPKACTKNLLEPVSDFRKISGYKINIQDFILFLYTSSEQSEIENNTIYKTIIYEILRDNSEKRYKRSIC